MIVIDTEIYSNYFLLSALQTTTGKIAHFEMHNDSDINISAIRSLMSNNTTVSFNGNNFDLPIIAYLLKGATNAQLKALCDKIIKTNLPAWRIANDLSIKVPTTWDHIDLIEVAPGQASLKIYGGRLNFETLQDLPIEPNAVIDSAQAETLRDYCVNDLRTTLELYNELSQQIALRCKMSEQYGVDLRSKSDAQIAENVIKSELTKLTGDKYFRPDLASDYSFRYQDPKIISFKTQELREVFDKLLKTDFQLGANGAVQLPDSLRERITVGGTEYKMGVGGLHSCEKKRTLYRQSGEILSDFDVASYYPSIILQQRLAPDSLGTPFLKVYQKLVDSRITAKNSGDKVTADTLKIVVNGSFGKLGSKWSALYAPDLLIQTTITGQLALLMLIESLELAGVSVVSANTDGVVVHTSADNERTIDEINFDWMMSTSYELERTDYAALCSRDVNTYLAVKRDGSRKGKGAFAAGGLMKNPDLPIIYDAVARYAAEGVDVESTILSCRDITRFVSLRKVTGGATWRGQFLGKAVRFYYSTDVAADECIRYVKNGNTVPKSAGAKPLMTLPDMFPEDINYAVYVEAAEKLMCEVGLR